MGWSPGDEQQSGMPDDRSPGAQQKIDWLRDTRRRSEERRAVTWRACSLSCVARLIHLNGPPGIGKSTIAKVYADRHPGALNLDIDQVVALIGGWQDMFWEAFEAGRLLAAGMARTHLIGGHDVVMPQLVANQREMTDFEAAVTDAGAEYCHVVLMADVESALARFNSRTGSGTDEHDIVINKVVEENGGPILLRKIYSVGSQPGLDDLVERLRTGSTTHLFFGRATPPDGLAAWRLARRWPSSVP
jgi:predicted kinase